MNRPGFNSYPSPQGTKSQKHGSGHDFGLSIKNKALHAKKFNLPSVEKLAQPASSKTNGTVTPGNGNKYAPKSNRQSLGYKRSTK